MTKDIINEININNANSNTIILKDNGVISSANKNIYQHIISYVNDDKYNIRNLDGEFLYKDKFNTNFIKNYHDTENYILDNYLGSLSVKYNDENNNVILTSRFDNNNYNFINTLFSEIYDIDAEIFDIESMNIEEQNEYLKRVNCIDYTLSAMEYVSSLNNAIKKGMFRQYNEFEHNDTKVKGRIDVSRQVIKNQSIQGRACYTTREYTSENIINMMILKTYIFLERNNKKLIEKLFSVNKDAQKYIVKLKTLLPNIEEYGISDIVSKGNVKITNMVYKEFESLRKVCLGILKSKGKRTFDENDTRISGIVFDIEKYWTRYIYNTIVKTLVDQDEEDSIKIINNKAITENDFILNLNNKQIMFAMPYSSIFENYENIDSYQKVEYDNYIKKVNEFAKKNHVDKIFIVYPNLMNDDFDFESYEDVIKRLPMDNIDIYKVPFVFIDKNNFKEYKNVAKKSIDKIKNIIIKNL